MKNSGVSERVIDFMINTPAQLGSANVGGMVGPTLPPPPPQTVVVAPGPDFIWIPGAWLWFGDRWMWRPGFWHRPMHPYWHGHRYR